MTEQWSRLVDLAQTRSTSLYPLREAMCEGSKQQQQQQRWHVNNGRVTTNEEWPRVFPVKEVESVATGGVVSYLITPPNGQWRQQQPVTQPAHTHSIPVQVWAVASFGLPATSTAEAAGNLAVGNPSSTPTSSKDHAASCCHGYSVAQSVAATGCAHHATEWVSSGTAKEHHPLNPLVTYCNIGSRTT